MATFGDGDGDEGVASEWIAIGLDWIMRSMGVATDSADRRTAGKGGGETGPFSHHRTDREGVRIDLQPCPETLRRRSAISLMQRNLPVQQDHDRNFLLSWARARPPELPECWNRPPTSAAERARSGSLGKRTRHADRSPHSTRRSRDDPAPRARARSPFPPVARWSGPHQHRRECDLPDKLSPFVRPKGHVDYFRSSRISPDSPPRLIARGQRRLAVLPTRRRLHS